MYAHCLANLKSHTWNMFEDESIMKVHGQKDLITYLSRNLKNVFLSPISSG
jgi:hypothetical protein